MAILGNDLFLDESGDLMLNPSGDLFTVQGDECLLQDVCHRLESSYGDVFSHENFGSLLFKYLGQPDTELNRALIKRSVITAIEQEKRINPNTIQVELIKYTPEEILVNISFIPREKIHPLTLLWGITIDELGALN
ncbi:MAG: GPW/gp25 family protein [Candidatus Marinimicrobia bacterium]|nr:GPW/gp25 family protein [Candidatus Neomarinimicrobiota bacterium]